MGLLIVLLMVLIVASTIISVLAAIVTYVGGGAVVGILFAIPVYFGVPWWGLAIYGAFLGLLVLNVRVLLRVPRQE